MGSNGVALKCVVNLDQLDVNCLKNEQHILTFNNQTVYLKSLFDFWRLCVRSPILEVWCNEDVMIHYNNDHNAYCSAVNVHNLETREDNTVWISIFLHTRNLYSYSHLDIFISFYSVRGDIDQM